MFERISFDAQTGQTYVFTKYVAVVTSRDGCESAGEVESMDVCTGEVTIRGVGQMSARITPLPGNRALVSAEVFSRRH